ncbi:unnamed protein product, partial [Schistosoma turkestanicum]
NKKTESSLPTVYPYNMELKVQIDNPELVLVEDIYNMDSNAIKLTTALSFGYNMQQNVIVINALINNLSVAACPYNETVGGPFSKEILSPSDLSFYASQPINGSVHGTLHMDTLTININPSTIRLLSTISASVQSSLSSSSSDKTTSICDNVSSMNNESTTHENKHLNDSASNDFWKAIPLQELNMPYLGLKSGVKNTAKCIEVSCDVAKVVEELENRRIDIVSWFL